MKKIIILGSTGSIGTQALDIVARHPDRFEVTGLAAGSKLDLVRAQIRQFKPQYVSVSRREDAETLRSEGLGAEVFWGEEGNLQVVDRSEADLVISAIVGAAGLNPTMRALETGKQVALANKESLVIAGEVMTRKAREKGLPLIPIDSEHNAIFQAMAGSRKQDVRRIILTASGGPFFQRPRETFSSITVEEALKHPNWKMGPKITVDSATLMNKGLEVIEATWLFDRPADEVAVHIHPQSIVHSLVEFIDGSILAQLGVPDMRCAISYAMSYPERVESGVRRLDLMEAGALSFHRPDLEKFPCLRLAYEVAKKKQTYPAVLNAANEVAVSRFLNREIAFLQIPAIVEKVLERHKPFALNSLEDVLEADSWARKEAAHS